MSKNSGRAPFLGRDFVGTIGIIQGLVRKGLKHMSCLMRWYKVVLRNPVHVINPCEKVIIQLTDFRHFCMVRLTNVTPNPAKIPRKSDNNPFGTGDICKLSIWDWWF